MLRKPIYAAVLATILMLGACKKSIDIQPEYQLDGSKPLSSITEAENAVTGMYASLRNADLYGGSGGNQSFTTTPDIMSDDLIETFESLGNNRRFSEWTYSSDNGSIYSTWVAAYQTIARANLILRDIDKFTGTNPTAVNRIKAQALALRAHMHFELFRYFAPTFTRNSDSLGIPYVKTFDVKAKPSRNSIKQCYDNILADLSQAVTLLANIDKPINSSSSRAYIDIAAVYGMQARVNLYAGQWADAISASTNAINLKPLAASSATFQPIWWDESIEEVLWAIQFDSYAEGDCYGNVYFGTNNRSIYRPSNDLVALYNQVTDMRYDAYITSIGSGPTYSGPSRLIVAKHWGKGSATDGVVNWKAYRTGEMYLIRAEANFKAGNQATALTDLNTLRSRRIVSFSSGTETGNALFTAIQTERRKELAFEAHRFFDLKRWGKLAIARTSCGTAGNSPSNICSLPSTSRAWAWPLPFNEIITNAGIVQNPGY
jgi:hypothetical protein